LIVTEVPDGDKLSDVKAIGNSTHLKDGGETDLYHQDDVRDYDLSFARRIAKGIYDAVGEVAFPETERERTLAGKITEDGYVVIDIRLDSKHYTISVGYRVLPGQLNLKFWGYLWYDESLIRRIYGPLRDTFAVSCLWNPTVRLTEDYVRETLKNLSKMSCPFNDISEIVTQILTRLTRVTTPFFDSHSMPLLLPP
jgi:hypothetical protein